MNEYRKVDLIPKRKHIFDWFKFDVGTLILRMQFLFSGVGVRKGDDRFSM
jgi:hypothetical protein